VNDSSVVLVAPFRVEIDAERLRSGNGLVDGELQRRLETRKFPAWRAPYARWSRATAVVWLLRGELTLHGVVRLTDAEVTVRRVDDKTLELEGEKVIDMQDYGLTPPKLLMFRVYPEVKVRAKLVAGREELSLTGKIWPCIHPAFAGAG